MRIIERSDKEYMEDLHREYEEVMKPLLNQGISLSECFRRMGVNTGRNSRRHRELRQIALDDGYKLRR